MGMFFTSCAFGVLVVLCVVVLEPGKCDDMDIKEEDDLTQELNCDLCGLACKTRCGTKRFRACCLRFVRRRRNGNLTRNMLFNADPVPLAPAVNQLFYTPRRPPTLSNNNNEPHRMEDLEY